jgi:hypothetical protein
MYVHYTTLHYTTLHYTTLHYTTLHYTTLHYTTLHYTTLHYTQSRSVHDFHATCPGTYKACFCVTEQPAFGNRISR